MKTCVLFTIYLLLLFPAQQANAQQPSSSLTNEDVVKMVQAGLATDLIMARIRKSDTEFDTSPSALAGLPKRGVPNEILLAMIESDPFGSNTHLSRKGRRMTAAAFRELQASVVTVWSEFGNGTGFIIDDAGLVLTSEHVVGPSEYVAVQFDRKRKVPAKLLASDPDADVAVLWINLDALPDASVAPLADPGANEPSVVEGERVVMIGSSLPERKVFTTGIASKVNKRSVVSDINLNRSDSGGPLFNSVGEAVGITTYLNSDVYGILRIEQVLPLIEDARRMMRRTSIPLARFLPVDPTEPFPLDTIKTAKELDVQHYAFEIGEFSVLVMTPNGHQRPTAELRNWAGYARADKAVLFIYAAPRSDESDAEFYKMRLFCGDGEVEPILPAKIARFVTPQDVTFQGIYAYSPNAISADCGTVKLEITSAGNARKAETKTLDRKVIARVDEDFSPYYQKYGRPPLPLFATQPDQTLGTSKPGKRFKWWDMSKYPK
jgi:S1-C subfamily serine protease